MDDRHLAGELREEEGLLQGRVAAADHADLLTAEEEPVAGGARRQAVAEQAGLGLQPQHERLGAGRHDHRVGLVPVLADPDLERTRGEVDRGGLGREVLGPEPLRLIPEAHHEIRPDDALGEARVVLDIGGEHQLPSGLIRCR